MRADWDRDSDLRALRMLDAVLLLVLLLPPLPPPPSADSSSDIRPRMAEESRAYGSPPLLGLLVRPRAAAAAAAADTPCRSDEWWHDMDDSRASAIQPSAGARGAADVIALLLLPRQPGRVYEYGLA